MAEQTVSSRPNGRTQSSEAPESAGLREELARSREEVLRLRDLLIAKDAEMGRLRGRLEQLEDRTARMLGAAVWLRRLGPATARLRALARRGRG
jgi:sugar/nucleoside kinase (ribokinase family)